MAVRHALVPGALLLAALVPSSHVGGQPGPQQVFWRYGRELDRSPGTSRRHGGRVPRAAVIRSWLRRRSTSWCTCPPGAAANSGVVGRLLLDGAPGGGEVFGWLLRPRDLPAMEETPEHFASVRRTEGVASADGILAGTGDVMIPARTKASVLLDRSRTTNAYLVLETSGGAGSTVTPTSAEALIDAKGQKGNRNEIDGRTVHGMKDVHRPDGGARRRFQTLYWRSYRYVQVDVETGDEPLRLHSVSGIFTGYPLVESGHFASDAKWIDDVWKMNWNGARLGAYDTYMDTPYYEQLQYVGDTRIQALITLYVSGDDRLMRQAIEHFDASRITDGLTTSRYPSEITQIMPLFSLIYAAMVHDYAMLRDDPAFVRQRLNGSAGVRGTVTLPAGVTRVFEWRGRRIPLRAGHQEVRF
jgi:alpha-L-rhamnosidase